MVFAVGLSAFLVAFVIFALVAIIRSVYLVRQAEVVLVERFGRFDRILTPGMHFIVPFFESTRNVTWSHIYIEGKKYYRVMETVDRIDLRERVYDFPKQNVITRDNVTMEINALLYYQITDARAAVYEVANLPEAIEKLTQTTLRNVIGSMDLDESLVSRDMVNERLRIILDEATDKWGVKVNRVELQEVNPPEDIRLAMEKQMRAERDRRAKILESEGKKSAAILEAEGVSQSSVLRAQGQAEALVIAAQAQANARRVSAAAEAEAISLIQQAAPNGDPIAYLVAMKYIQALPDMAEGKDTKLVVVPYEASAMMGSLAGMKKLFQEQL